MLDPANMSRRRLRVFVSSAMQELLDERQTIKSALDDLKIDAWIYESDAGARDQSTRETYLRELQAADLYIGVFWKRYGAYTIDEYRQAAAWRKPRLIFVKRAEDDEREEPLRSFLLEVTAVSADRAPRWFLSAGELREFIKNDVAGWQADLVRRTTEPGSVPVFQVEALTDQYVERTAVLDAAKSAWLEKDLDGLPRVTRAAIHGLPGAGKSVMARAFAHDETVRSAFPDGVLSGTLGSDAEQSVDVTRLQSAWGRALHDREMSPAGYPDQLTGLGQLRSLLQNKACLLLLDDVWEPDHVRPFLVGGPRCLLLVTTRKLEVADAIGATALELAPMTAAEALTLMERWSGTLTAGDRDIAMFLGNEVGWLPFALELMAAQAKNLGWQSYRERWRTQKLTSLRRGRRGAGREHSVADSLELSYESLKDDAERYSRLAVFGANTPITASPAAALWSSSEAEAQDLLQDFSSQALLSRLGPPGATRYSLHSLLQEFLLERLGPAVKVAHSNLVDGYRQRSSAGWADVPDDGYFGDRLAFHLVAAGRVSELWSLLDRRWMAARFSRHMSHVPFLADVRVGLQAARRDPVDVAAFVRCAVIHMTVSALAGDDPPNMPTALAEVGEIRIALNRAGAISRADLRAQAYIDIAEVSLRAKHPDDALAAAQLALAAAEEELSGRIGLETLARAATCLGRCGRDTSLVLERARALALDAPVVSESDRVSALAAVAEGFTAFNNPQTAADVVGQMLRLIELSAAKDSIWMFSDAAKGLSKIGAGPALHTLRDLAIARVQDGSGGYPLSSVARALASCGDFDAALGAARQIPEKYMLIESMADIAGFLEQHGQGTEAVRVYQEALGVFADDLRRGAERGETSKRLLEVAGALRAADSLDHLLTIGEHKDAVWHSWFLAGLARAHRRSGSDSARIGALAREAVEVLGAALRAGPVHGEAVRAEAATFLAEAGAVGEALSVAHDIDDARYRKEALASIAMCLLGTGQQKEARDLLLRSLLGGRPDPAEHLVRVAQCAKAFARIGEMTSALATVESCLQQMSTIERDNEAQIRVAVLAVEVFDLCKSPARAREVADRTVALLKQNVTYDDALRSEAVYLAIKAGADEAVESVISAGHNWFFLRTVAQGVVKGLIATDQSARALQFFEELDSRKQNYLPWNEQPKADALAYMFAIPSEQVRRWVLDAVTAIRSSGVRSQALAKCAGVLAAEGDAQAQEIGRSAIRSAVQIDDAAQQQPWSIAVANALADARTNDLVLEALVGVSEPSARDEVLARLAAALARKRQAVETIAAVKAIAAGPERNGWIVTIADLLLEAREYEAALKLYELVTWPPELARDYAAARTSEALARHGQHEQARQTAEAAFRRARTTADANYSPITSQLALCFAQLGEHDAARELADRARAQDGPFWTADSAATVAAAYAIAGDRPSAQQMVLETMAHLRLVSESRLPDQIESCARTWSAAGAIGMESLLEVTRGIKDVWRRADAYGRLGKSLGAAIPPTMLDVLIDEACAIPEIWASVRALGALVEPSAAARNMPALHRFLEIASRLENGWARGDLIGALASAVAQLADEDLLDRILAETSDLRADPWKSAASLAQAAQGLHSRGEAERARAVTRRALEIATNAVENDERTRAVYEAERAACLALLGRDDAAGAALTRAIDAWSLTPPGYQQNTIGDALEIGIDEIAPAMVHQLVSAVGAKRPTLVARAALRMTRLERVPEAAALLEAVRTNHGAEGDDRSAVLFLCAQTLAAMSRPSEAILSALDGLDAGRSLNAAYHSAVVGDLAEVLSDLRHVDGIHSLHDALTATARWWD